MTRKNIVLVSFDDAVAPWPYQTIFGEPLQLPNLEAFCQSATAFHAAYAQAPICGPSRASMMTTMMPHETGVLDNSLNIFREVSPKQGWSSDLKAAGYFCSSGGKVHHRYKPLRDSHHEQLYSDAPKHFSDDMGLERDVRERAKHFGGHRRGRATEDFTDDATFYDYQSAESAISFFENYQGEAPFYREVGFYSPHVPHITPARFKRLYDSKKFKKPSNWQGFLYDNAYVNNTLSDMSELDDLAYWQKSVRNYFSAYSHGDYHFGRVMAALQASKFAKNTVVILVSDHGFHLGNRNLFRKSTMWEQSLRIPLIIYDPDQPQPQIVNDPVGLIDIGPTVMDFAQLPPLPRKFGRSLRPYMQGHRDPARAVPSYFRRNMSLVKEGLRLIRYGDDTYQFFDIEKDFWNLQDLGTDHPKFAELRDLLMEMALSSGFEEEAPDLAGSADDESEE